MTETTAPDPFKRLGQFRLNPEPLPAHTKRMRRLYSPEEVDALNARIAELEAALRKIIATDRCLFPDDTGGDEPIDLPGVCAEIAAAAFGETAT